jgi:transcriptional regulator with XRE-family HTH domain
MAAEENLSHPQDDTQGSSGGHQPGAKGRASQGDRAKPGSGAQPKRRRSSPRSKEEAGTVARALLRLRRESGMTLHQLSAAANCTAATLDRYEQGASNPRVKILKRLVEAMGLSMADLYRAQRRGENEEGDAADGTLPPDTRKPDSAMSASNATRASLRLAQECGKGRGTLLSCLHGAAIWPAISRRRPCETATAEATPMKQRKARPTAHGDYRA